MNCKSEFALGFSDQRQSYVAVICCEMRTSLKKVETWVDGFIPKCGHPHLITNSKKKESFNLGGGRTPAIFGEIGDMYSCHA
jgi:predicted transcriptional regulator YheO